MGRGGQEESTLLISRRDNHQVHQKQKTTTKNDDTSIMGKGGRQEKGESTTTTSSLSSYQDGFRTFGKAIMFGLLALTFTYVILVKILTETELGSYLVPAKEYCNENENDNHHNNNKKHLCARPDLFAFQVGSGICIFYVGIVGLISWHITKNPHNKNIIPQTPVGRLFGFISESEKLAAVSFTFQTWDFFVSLFIKEHNTNLMLMHHALAATVSYLSLRYQYLHYYGVFFLGLSEFSSIFLLLLDLGKYFPPVKGTVYDFLFGLSGPLFALTFTIYRVILWWKVSYLLWTDAYYVIKKGIAEQMRPGKTYVLNLFLVANIPLGLLQLYWFTIILKEVAKIVEDLII